MSEVSQVLFRLSRWENLGQTLSAKQRGDTRIVGLFEQKQKVTNQEAGFRGSGKVQFG